MNWQDYWSNRKILGLCGAFIYLFTSIKVALFHTELLVSYVLPLTGGIIAFYFGKNILERNNGNKQ